MASGGDVEVSYTWRRDRPHTIKSERKGGKADAVDHGSDAGDAWRDVRRIQTRKAACGTPVYGSDGQVDAREAASMAVDRSTQCTTGRSNTPGIWTGAKGRARSFRVRFPDGPPALREGFAFLLSAKGYNPGLIRKECGRWKLISAHDIRTGGSLPKGSLYAAVVERQLHL